MATVSGDGVDPNLMNDFLNRIAALEGLVGDVNSNDLLRRVKDLETRADKNDLRHTQFAETTDTKLNDHERRI